jgi:hypothetical protein
MAVKWLSRLLMVLACVILWIWSACVLILPWMIWTNDSRYYPEHAFLEPDYLAMLITSVLVATLLTVAAFWNQERPE